MRIGLIARSEIARGIAIQSRNFYDHMPVDSVLLVRMPQPDCVEAPDWYANRVDAVYDRRHHQLDEDLVRGWLSTVDVVFTVETPNDWRIPLWCKEMGVKLVIQGNPEFVRHGTPGYEQMPHPDEWWWPTRWRLENLPPGQWMPVPHDPRPAPRTESDRLRVLHVIGKRAWADRNGTDLLVQAVRMFSKPITLTLHSIDEGLPEFPRVRDVEYVKKLSAVDDRWTMYENQDVLLLPRRYGGLCLPALEAAACGLVVAMTNTSPNEELAAIRFGGQTNRRLDLACGPVPSIDASPTRIAETINWLASQPGEMETLRQEQIDLLPRWDVWRKRYLDRLERLVG